MTTKCLEGLQLNCSRICASSFLVNAPSLLSHRRDRGLTLEFDKTTWVEYGPTRADFTEVFLRGRLRYRFYVSGEEDEMKEGHGVWNVTLEKKGNITTTFKLLSDWLASDIDAATVLHIIDDFAQFNKRKPNIVELQVAIFFNYIDCAPNKKVYAIDITEMNAYLKNLHAMFSILDDIAKWKK